MATLEDRKAEAEIAHLSAQAAKLEVERAMCRRGLGHWLVETLKVVGALILGAGGIITVFTGYQLAEIKKEGMQVEINRLEARVAEQNKDIGKNTEKKRDLDAAVANAEAQLATAQGLLQKTQKDLGDLHRQLLTAKNSAPAAEGPSFQAAITKTQAIQTEVKTADSKLSDALSQITEELKPIEGLKPGDRTVISGIAFRWCPPGSFQMGSPDNEKDRQADEPIHPVNLSRGFWMAENELTLGQWGEVLARKTSTASANPVTRISWSRALDWCRARTKLSNLPLGWKFTLPTEAQWEYACRAGTTTAYSFGSNPEQLNEYAWYARNSNLTNHQIANKKPNPWGLHDMHGNVWEWCLDFYSPQYMPRTATDPIGPPNGPHRVFRGGGWADSAGNCRSSSRFKDSEDYDTSASVGFRPVVLWTDP